MFYHLYPYLIETFPLANIFRAITARAAMAAITAFALSFILGPFFIRKLQRLRVLEKVKKEDCPLLLQDLHKEKGKIPTMGGLFILASIIIAIILFGDLTNRYVHLALLVTVWLGILGFADDALKLTGRLSGGLTVRAKLFWQVALGLAIGFYLYFYPVSPEHGTSLTLPFSGGMFLPLGVLYIPFVALVIVATSNAVNLADGLDGLAIGCIALAILSYGVVSYVAGHAVFSAHLGIVSVSGAGELSIVSVAMVGAALGFLWFNAFPAQIFMGNTGSLALGGLLSIIAVITKQELLLLIIGGIFVLEALSVIIQVVSYRWRKKRVFLVAPLHHHFELKGWPESKIIIRFWIIAIIFVVLGLSSLRL
ncbi:phospho-N-acetylmuramoyl-pentapeptide-transferase [candidate division NPL-UPA2 bacterium Unc8]|uniref:Phospho-N-acetylmuramoyl-pentapeptide-transferase n=1 Tax=candidate division NPL-UPA2 bacterium Unc8 TaxID=1980939 RepID=A0A399FX16_UNCN2|nr:Phospho-N-acetylmuramoyl-pentapeptide-transferase [Bacillota bacterium]MBT9137738.1 Phospho-N-acetylmuramoyl-pentapeptide-transferase [Bacillota bacterium]RIH99761.1 MAG: phospho-N-acetylmuramoyl-pentapeptide-transferase [candidate division NPL-UPA2 bacterium Unc8]